MSQTIALHFVPSEAPGTVVARHGWFLQHTSVLVVTKEVPATVRAYRSQVCHVSHAAFQLWSCTQEGRRSAPWKKTLPPKHQACHCGQALLPAWGKLHHVVVLLEHEAAHCPPDCAARHGACTCPNLESRSRERGTNLLTKSDIMPQIAPACPSMGSCCASKLWGTGLGHATAALGR